MISTSFESYLAQKLDHLNDWLIANQLLVALELIVFSIIFLYYINDTHKPVPRGPLTKENSRAPVLPSLPKKDFKNPMQAPDVILNAPLETPFTVTQLAEFNGLTEGKPIYVAMKGIIFDVSAKKEMYGPGAGYNVFAGKDGSRGLGRSSLKPEDAVSDYSVLTAEELVVLEDWVKYFKKRYNIIGKLIEA